MLSKTKQPSKIIGIQFSLLSPEEIRKQSVVHITSHENYINNKPAIGGLFDPRMGVLDPGLICPTDGLNYIQTPGYFGHIELARPVFYIQHLTQIIKIARCVCYRCSKLLLNKAQYSYLLNEPADKRWEKVFQVASKINRCGLENDDGCGCKQPDKIKKSGLATIIAEWTVKDEENMTVNLTPELLVRMFSRITNDDVHFMGFSPKWSRPEWMICQVLAVPPPAMRPSVKLDGQQRSEDDISQIIVNILKTNKALQDKIDDNNENIIDDLTLHLQYYIAAMVNNNIPGADPVAQRSGRPLKSIIERLNGKFGRVRGNLMGKRVDFSARSVITPDASISMKELGVPMKVAMNITYPEIVNDRNRTFLRTLMLNGPNTYPGAKILEKASGESISLKYVDRSNLVLENGDKVHRHMLDGDPVLFNRQPTLHRMSMMCHIVKVMREGNTFRMNLAVTAPYNADFDGDEMNMHMPQDEEARSELLELALTAKQMMSPSTNSPVVGIFQDSLLGIYRITRDTVRFTPRQAMNLLMGIKRVNPAIFSDRERLLSSFEIISQILPPLTMKFKNGLFNDDEDFATSNNVIEIVNGKLKRGQIEKKTLKASAKGLLQSIFNDFGYDTASSFIDDLQSVVTEYMRSSSYSVGVSDLIADDETNKRIIDAVNNKKREVNDLIQQVQMGVYENNTGKTNVDQFETDVNAILNKAQEEAGKIGRKSLDPNNRFVIMVNAGSKGSNMNIAQMISCLGQQNVDGRRIPYGLEYRTLPHFSKFDDSPAARGFVESSFVQGLTPQEMFFHQMGGRVGLIDTAVKTSQTGYIQRRLIKGMEDLKIEYDMTVRNHHGKIIQFKYGDDNYDSAMCESQSIPFVQKTIAEIYDHFMIPDDSVYDVILNEKARERHSETSDKYKQECANIVDKMIYKRQTLIEDVFQYEDTTRVHVPVNFPRIIQTIVGQTGSDKSSNCVDVSPLECFDMIYSIGITLERLKLMNPLTELLLYYYLSPKELLLKYRMNFKTLDMLKNMIVLQYKKAMIIPGEMVGMIAAQSIGEPATQMTLNTFHSAGVASKSNVTRGVPRFEELLKITPNPKQPSTSVYLPPNKSGDQKMAQQLIHILENTTMKDITSSVSICFDPDDMNTLIEEDREMMSQYNEFSKQLCEMGMKESKPEKMSKWIIRIELDKEQMLEKNLTMDDIHFTINNSYGNDITCVFSDYNANDLVFRVRVKGSIAASKQTTLDQSDEIYMLKNIEHNLMNNIILKGVKGIKKANLRKLQNSLVHEDGKYVKKEKWVVDTVGTNLKTILAMDDIDSRYTYSNDIVEIYETLGIEAARQAIFNEMNEVIEFGGSYVNSHHLDLLVDRMTCKASMVSIFRHGINNDDIGPIAKASFEETPEMFMRAARHGDVDAMRGVSASVMTGQNGYFGTSSFNVVLDMDKLLKVQAGSKLSKDKRDLFDLRERDDECAVDRIENIKDMVTVRENGVCDDDDYDMDL
jgi:DNA-directed RNA polymerase II subunit RPB1